MTKGVFSLERKPDGSVSIVIEDYDVEAFDGADYEMIYTLDPDNLARFTDILTETHEGTLEQMIEAEFGIHLDKHPFGLWMRRNDIDYDIFTWVSYS